jgi:hypothetical protein
MSDQTQLVQDLEAVFADPLTNQKTPPLEPINQNSPSIPSYSQFVEDFKRFWPEIFADGESLFLISFSQFVGELAGGFDDWFFALDLILFSPD